jgi:hypothetical protein
MKTLIIGFVDDSVNPIFKGITIRIAHLLGEQLRMAGNLSFYAGMEEYMRNISIEQKMKFIEEHEKDNPKALELHQHYKILQKLYRKDKGRDKELIVLKKQIERIINDIYNVKLDEMMDLVKSSGLTDLKTIEAVSTYREYYVSHRAPEINEEECHRLSDILQLKLDEEEDQNPVFIALTDVFFSPEFAAVNDEMPAINAFSEQGFLQELFNYPNYNILSITDLNTIRYAVTDTLTDFQQAVNEFAGLTTRPNEAFDYLQTNIVEKATLLAESMEKTVVIANYKKLISTNQYFGKLYLGMIPRFLVFKYFKYIKASQEETTAVLEQLPDDDVKQLIPVFITSFNGNNLMAKEEADAVKPELIPLKKSLTID